MPIRWLLIATFLVNASALGGVEGEKITASKCLERLTKKIAALNENAKAGGPKRRGQLECQVNSIVGYGDYANSCEFTLTMSNGKQDCFLEEADKTVQCGSGCPDVAELLRKTDLGNIYSDF